METTVLVIFDLDDCYAKELADYISEKPGMPFKTIAFTEKSSFMEYATENHIDVLLISSESIDERIKQQDIGKIILLSEGKIFSEYIGYSSIYKYQSTENVIREVLDYFVDVHRECNMVPISKGEAEIIGIFSPLGRIGKTTFALTLGQILSEEYSTLYVNLEEFSAFDKIFCKAYTGDLADLMYFFKQNPNALSVKLQTIVHNLHGMDYIPPLLYSEDLRNIDVQEWIKFIETIARVGAYEVIILDLSNMVKNVFEMLNICNRIYMPMNDEKLSLMKISSYEEFLLKTGREDIVDRTMKIEMPAFNKQSMEENDVAQQVWGRMGDFVRKTLKREAC